MPQTVRLYVGRMRGHVPLDSDHARLVAPHDLPSDSTDGVPCVLEVDWEDALAVCADVTLLDSLPVEVVHVENTSDL
jgi:hypothetical protein